MAMTGNQTTLVLSGGFTAHYHQIGGTKESVPKIKTSHLLTVSSETYIPGDLVDRGEMDLELEFDPNSPPPLKTVQTATVTFPVPSGLTNGATLAGTGFIMERESASMKNNELAVGKYKWCWDGLTGPTFTSAS